MRPQHVNFARNVYIRDMMVRDGYAHKPIWMSEAAWNPVPEPSVNPNIDGRYNYGQVTEEQARPLYGDSIRADATRMELDGGHVLLVLQASC
jgi:hypothetical protein